VKTKIVLILLLGFMLLWVFDLGKSVNDYRLANQKLSRELKSYKDKLPHLPARSPKKVKCSCDRECNMKKDGYSVK